jgi:hypothetical protein
MTWIWTGWLFALVASFAALEAYAIIKNKKTLSRTVWTWSKNFPLLPWIAGVLCGGLAVHFWWGGVMCFAPIQ